MPPPNPRSAALWSLIAGLALLPILVGWLLDRPAMRRRNFQGREIPTAFGLIILLWSSAALVCLAVLGHSDSGAAGNPANRLLRAFTGPGRDSAVLAYLAIVAGFGLLGFLDDWLGNRSATGLRGHLRALLRERRVTTGLVKAIGGLALAIAVPRYLLGATWPGALLDGLLIALSANAMNLLDLRPGRACAAYLAAAALLGLRLAGGQPGFLPLLLVAIPTVTVYERDARGLAMLGDTGSNLLGGVLGLAFVLAFPGWIPRMLLLCLLAALHLLAERRSLTGIIEANPVLRSVDRLTGVR